MINLIVIHVRPREKEKKPIIKTLEDKGTKIDFVDFGDGNQVFLYQSEKFRGLGIGAFKLGWTNKYNIITPQQLTKGTINTMSANASAVSGLKITPNDFVMHSASEKKTKKAEDE